MTRAASPKIPAAVFVPGAPAPSGQPSPDAAGACGNRSAGQSGHESVTLPQGGNPVASGMRGVAGEAGEGSALSPAGRAGTAAPETRVDLPLYSYDVVMADPPWPWKTYSVKGQSKSPEAQYDTMSFEDIDALRLGDLLAPGGVMFLWCTWPLIGRQVEAMRAWGLEPKTGGVWAKRTAKGKFRWGTGYVLRSVCEPFIVGALPGHRVRGASTANLIETIEDAAVDGLAREHSRKPDEVYGMIEALTPGMRRADIFSRQRRAGWDGWGKEIGKFEAVA